MFKQNDKVIVKDVTMGDMGAKYDTWGVVIKLDYAVKMAYVRIEGDPRIIMSIPYSRLILDSGP